MAEAAKAKLDEHEKELLELGKKLQMFYESGYVNRREAFTFSFLKGILAGLGGVLGATVALAILLWILSGLDQVPFVGHFTEQLRQTIEHRPR